MVTTRYQHHYGPIEAQRELDFLTYQPAVRGLDYGYGIPYFIGDGPPKQYRQWLASDATLPNRAGHGLIDARWTSGYRVRDGQHHHACGDFHVCPGCTCLAPSQYRSFAPAVVPAQASDNVGASWYTGYPMANPATRT